MPLFRNCENVASVTQRTKQKFRCSQIRGETLKIFNPLAVTSQIQGGIMMELGYALSAGLAFDGGRVTNASFADYKIAPACDIPAATPIIVEKDYSSEPYGAKGVGEIAVFGIAPAVANAIARLTGVRITDLPAVGRDAAG